MGAGAGSGAAAGTGSGSGAGAADHNEGAFAVTLLDWLDLVDLIYWAK